jgi:hypothetical protein
MTKNPMPKAGSAATRFKKGQSGNPKGRPRKPKPPVSSPFAILDVLLEVHEGDGVSQMRLEDAVLLKTYQRAISGSRRAGKKIVKMILEREKLRESRAPPRPPISIRYETDPENALEALQILGIASWTTDEKANLDYGRNRRLRLQRWVVEAALKHRNHQDLSSSDKQLIQNSMHDRQGLKWPRSVPGHD